MGRGSEDGTEDPFFFQLVRAELVLKVLERHFRRLLTKANRSKKLP